MRAFKFFSDLCYLWLILSLSHCATLSERTVNVQTAQIQQKLNAKLAQPLTVLKVFQVQLSNALVLPETASGRLNATVDTVISSPLTRQTLTGKLAISGMLQFDAVRSAVILEAPQVNVVQIDGASSEIRGMLNKLSQEIASKWINQMVLYQVKPEDLTLAGTRYQPIALRVVADGLQIKLKPQR